MLTGLVERFAFGAILLHLGHLLGAELRSHSGQVSFPGGRAEPGDASAEFTALRESEEEIGLKPERVEIVARLPDYFTRTGYRITPVVGLLAPPLELAPDPREVADIF